MRQHRKAFQNVFESISFIPETTHDLRMKKNEVELNLQDAIAKFEADTGLTVTEIVPHRARLRLLESTAGAETTNRAGGEILVRQPRHGDLPASRDED